MNKFFCSWSGGKDSCLALYYAIREGGNPGKLLTMLIGDGERSRSHGLPLNLLKKQSLSLNIPLITRATSWEDYEENFVSILRKIKREGITAGVFGDIDLEEHRVWVEKVCARVDIKPYLPLWKKPRRRLLEDFIESGFKATIVAVKDGVLDRRFLGEVLDLTLIEDLENEGVDASGEEGEFHTVVTDGPIFSFEISLKKKEQVFSNGYWFQNVEVIE